MTQSWRSWGAQLAAGVAMGFAIASFGNCASAQITPDGTLPNNSVVTPQGTKRVISGGTQKGSNLFHSFEEFSVPTGGTAYFNNALNIQNIISRVTGKSISNIDGLLRANGTANLFLLNPNGIIFGPNASLNIGGSFLGSTASAINFADGTSFSATAPQTTPLLTVSVPLGLQFGRNPGSIVNQSQAQSLSGQTNSVDGPVGLQVPTGHTLALIGGDVIVSGGNLTAKGGRIYLASVTGEGEVSLSQTGNSWSLSYDKIDAFGDIRLTGGLLIDASGDGGGDVQIQSAKFEMTQGANIFADTLGSGDGGQVIVRTTEAIALRDGSGITADVSGSGTGGDLRIETGRLSVSDGAVVSASTLGTGAGGTLSVTAADAIELIGTSADGQFNSGLFASTEGDGNAGDLTITTGRLLVKDGAVVSASTFGTGAGGTLSVTASDVIEVIGTTADGQFGSRLFSQTYGDGNAGDLTITTGRLLVKDGAQIGASTFGTGAGGTLSITAADAVEVIGRSADGQLGSGLFARTYGDGNAGDLTITTGRLLVKDGAVVSAGTFGNGAGGMLSVTAAEAVEVIGESADGQFPSGLSAETEADGNAGDLTITTGRLLVKDGAVVSAGTFGNGAGGTLSVTAADAIELIGTSADGQFPSGLFAQTEADGNAGDLTITAGRLLVKDGAVVSAGTFGNGAGGTLSVTAADAIELIGTSADGQFPSGLSAQAEADGNAGDLTITTGRLLVKGGAVVSASTLGFGDGGTLSVTASDAIEVIGESADGQLGSGLSAQTQGDGNAGDLRIATGRLLVKGGAQVSASTFGIGDGGTLSVTAADAIELIGRSADGQFPSGLFAKTEGDGNAGDLTITTGRLLVKGGANVTVRSEGSGIAGNLQLTAHSFGLDNRGAITATTLSGQGGNITLQAQDLLLLRNNSNISTTAGNAGAGGDGGNITITTPFIVAVPSENSDITANAFTGRGGRVQVNAQGIFGTQFRPQLTPESEITASSTFGVSGEVELNTPDVDPSAGLIALPVELVNVPGLIATGCSALGENEFIITGRGGLPPSPEDPLRAEAVLADWATLGDRAEGAGVRLWEAGVRLWEAGVRLWEEINTDSLSNHSPLAPSAPSAPSAPPALIVEAQGWVINDKGEVVLTATAPTVTPHIPWIPAANCHASQNSSPHSSKQVKSQK